MEVNEMKLKVDYPNLYSLVKTFNFNTAISNSDKNVENVIEESMNEICRIAEKSDWKSADVKAIISEVGYNICEEAALKARAIIGRMIRNCSFGEFYLMVSGIIKLNCYLWQGNLTALKERIFKKEATSTLGLDEAFISTIPDLAPACILLLAWAMLIEVGTCKEIEEETKKYAFPSTLSQCIFLNNLVHQNKWFLVDERPSNLRTFEDHRHVVKETLGMFLDFFIQNINRAELFVDGKNLSPHQSEVSYLTTVKLAYQKIGGDPNNYIYHCLDHDRQNWSLFSYLTTDV